MKKNSIGKILKDFSIFFWVIIISIISAFVSNIYNQSKKEQSNKIFESLDNIYLKKTIKQITSKLKPRYRKIEYTSKSGDTYENIIKNLNIDELEKKNFLEAIKQTKTLKILGVNQKFSFVIDNLNNRKIIKFTIETDKKNEIVFNRISGKNLFDTKKIQKNFTKKNTYKESVITSSLYNSAINIKIKPNIIVEFARLYGFQVDFQRDVWKNDSFQIIYEEYLDTDGNVVDTGNILFANLKLQNTDLQLYRYEYEKDKIDFFDESGKSIKKTLMKTPINGARLSSAYGKRKHPILGYTKMHLGTDFAAPTGTPIMASGDGVVLKAQWCGGGGNCVKIKHNSVYQTVYAHMSKFAKGVKKEEELNKDK